MVGIEQIQKIVKGYFDNAVIIDDQLKVNFGEDPTPPDFGEIDDSAFDEVAPTTEDVVAASNEVTAAFDEITAASSSQQETSPASERPNQALEQLIKEGFVTFPYRFERGKSKVNDLANILHNTKLLIVDWNLENSHEPGLRGNTAIEFLNTFVGSKKTLKCAVIYTQEPDLVLAKLKLHFDVQEDEDFLFFEEKDRSEGNSLFGFVMDKNTAPQQIVEQICKVLYKNRSLVIHLMDSSNRLEKNLSKALSELNHTFENMIFTQVLTSEVPGHQIPEFVDSILLSTVMNEFTDDTCPSYLFLVKKNNLLQAINAHGFIEDRVMELVSLLKVKGTAKDRIPYVLKQPDFVTSLKQMLGKTEVDTLDKFENELITICNPYLTEEQKAPKELKRMQKLFTLFLILWETYIREGMETFQVSYAKEIYRFTKLMKYVDYVDKHIETGTIIKTEKNGEYLLCVTPFCDVHEPSKIKNHFKFVVGRVVQIPDKDSSLLKNTEDNCHYMAVPDAETKKVIFIRWEFYNVRTIPLELDNINDIGQPLLNLKKDYIQKVLNRYLAYQSRAGVNEMFYKESSYISNFFKLIQ